MDQFSLRLGFTPSPRLRLRVTASLHLDPLLPPLGSVEEDLSPIQVCLQPGPVRVVKHLQQDQGGIHIHSTRDSHDETDMAATICERAPARDIHGRNYM